MKPIACTADPSVTKLVKIGKVIAAKKPHQPKRMPATAKIAEAGQKFVILLLTGEESVPRIPKIVPHKKTIQKDTMFFNFITVTLVVLMWT